MKNIKKYLVFVLFISAAVASFAQSAGRTALPFLRMDMGARYYGMAGAATAFADDVTGMTFYNPAAAGKVESFQISGSTFESNLDMKNHYAGLAFPVGFLSFFGNNPTTLGISAYIFDKGDIEDLNVNRQIGDDLSFTLTIGEHIGTSTWDLLGDTSNLDHYVGINARYIRSSLPKPEGGDAKADAFAFDAGYDVVIDNHYGLGIAVKNLGSKIKYINEKDPLPTTINAGIFYTPVDMEYVKWTLTSDYIRYIKDKEDRIRVGTEAVFMDILAVRGGLRLMEEIDTEYTLGFGLKLFGFEVDFGTILNPQLNDDNLYQASISYKFPVAKKEKKYKEEKKRTEYKEYKKKEVETASETAERNASPILYQ